MSIIEFVHAKGIVYRYAFNLKLGKYLHEHEKKSS